MFVTNLAATAPAPLPRVQMSRMLVGLAVGVLAAGAILLWLTQSGRMAALFALGAFLGLALIQAGFGFTAGLAPVSCRPARGRHACPDADVGARLPVVLSDA